MATERLNFRNKYSKIFFSEAIRGMKLKLCINVYDISLYINCVFIAVAHVFSLLWQLKVKSESRPFFYLTIGILTEVLQQCSLSILI